MYITSLLLLPVSSLRHDHIKSCENGPLIILTAIQWTRRIATELSRRPLPRRRRRHRNSSSNGSSWRGVETGEDDNLLSYADGDGRDSVADALDSLASSSNILAAQSLVLRLRHPQAVRIRLTFSTCSSSSHLYILRRASSARLPSSEVLKALYKCSNAYRRADICDGPKIM